MLLVHHPLTCPQTVGLELVKIILLTIPYAVSSTPSGDLAQKASEMLEKTDIVASTPHALESIVEPYVDQDEAPSCKSMLSVLQSALQNEAAAGWPLACIPRAHQIASAEAQTEEDEKTTHPFPSLAVPSPLSPGDKPLFPELFFSLFVGDVESVPPPSNVAAPLLRDAIVDTVNMLDANRNVAAKFLIDIDCFWTQGTFVKRATAFDKLKDFPAGASTWKPEDTVIDAIFSQIFQLPTPEHRLVYYHSLITESCKIAPAAVAPTLGRAIRFLFRSLEIMDLELAYRYMDWFAHHLSNFDFRWKWTEW